MRYDACYYCDEPYAVFLGDDGVVDHYEPECECEAREAKRQAAEDAYWDQKINEARGK